MRQGWTRPQIARGTWNQRDRSVTHARPDVQRRAIADGRIGRDVQLQNEEIGAVVRVRVDDGLGQAARIAPGPVQLPGDETGVTDQGQDLSQMIPALDLAVGGEPRWPRSM